VHFSLGLAWYWWGKAYLGYVKGRRADGLTSPGGEEGRREGGRGVRFGGLGVVLERESVLGVG